MATLDHTEWTALRVSLSPPRPGTCSTKPEYDQLTGDCKSEYVLTTAFAGGEEDSAGAHRRHADHAPPRTPCHK